MINVLVLILIIALIPILWSLIPYAARIDTKLFMNPKTRKKVDMSRPNPKDYKKVYEAFMEQNKWETGIFIKGLVCGILLGIFLMV